jgi:uncharacterized protein YbjQ (UPF0145 family)
MTIMRSRTERSVSPTRRTSAASRPMLVVTTDSLPGYEIRTVLGEVLGVTTRTHNVYAEGVKDLHGGLNPHRSAALMHWREETVARMAAAARELGANAVVGMRFDHRGIGEQWAELCAYGTAVVAVRLRRAA